MKTAVVAIFLTALLFSLPMAPAGASETDVARPAVRLIGEAGFLGVIDHRIRFAEEDSTFRYQSDGGQDVLFPYARLSAELTLQNRHTVVFLYQPLELETRTSPRATIGPQGSARCRCSS